jgi:cation:H+ antiporter
VSTGLATAAFLAAVAATLGASELLVWGLSRLGFRLGLAAGLMGLLTALGADSPEIASATSATFSGARDVGVGVIVGSNLFNLAALLGLPGVIRGRLGMRRVVPSVDGGASLLVLLVAAALLTGRLGPRPAVALFAVVLAVYAAILSLPPRRIRQLRLSRQVTAVLVRMSAQIHSEDMLPDVMRVEGGWLPVWFLPLALVIIVAGSVVMVTTAILLGQRWHVPSVIVGTIGLAAITGLPNLYAAVRLALRGDGATVVSAAFNSNTLNLAVGLGLPAVVLGADPASAGPSPVLLWLGGLTLAAVLITVLQAGLTRTGGAAIILGYAGFLAVLIRDAGA